MYLLAARCAALIVLAACAAPAPAPPVPRPEPALPARPLVFRGTYQLPARRLADSLAARYGLATGLPDGRYYLPEDWQRRWPVGPGWLALMPGRLPGLRAWLTVDSLTGYVYRGDYGADSYHFQLRYPAFAGRQADSLRRRLGQLSGLPAELAQVRRLRLHARPRPRQPWPYPDEPRPSDCEGEETNTLDCFTLGAYVLGADTVVSTAGTTYYIGHCVHGSVGRVTGTYSLRRQRLLGFDDLFRPELRRALHHTLAGYVLWHRQARWHADRPNRRGSYAQYPLTGPLRQWQDSLREYALQAQDLRLLRRPDLPPQAYPTFSGDRMSTDDPTEYFYFSATGVVFIMGSDLGTWELLLPYAALAPYLCGANDAPSSAGR